MSEQSAIDTYGDELFGRGTQAALDALGKAYELAFMKSLSQLSSPSATIVDRTGHIGVAREIANYKTSLALADALALQVSETATRAFKAILKQLSGEFSEFAADAGSRIINASAFADETTTVERAIAEIFQASDDFVQDLLAPTPGADWSVHEIEGAIQDALAAGDSADVIIKRLQQTGVGIASESMTTLSLGSGSARAARPGPTAGARLPHRPAAPHSCSTRCSTRVTRRRCRSTRRSPSISTPGSRTGFAPCSAAARPTSPLRASICPMCRRSPGW